MRNCACDCDVAKPLRAALAALKPIDEVGNLIIALVVDAMLQRWRTMSFRSVEVLRISLTQSQKFRLQVKAL